jgi:hypothetical protein
MRYQGLSRPIPDLLFASDLLEFHSTSLFTNNNCMPYLEDISPPSKNRRCWYVLGLLVIAGIITGIALRVQADKTSAEYIPPDPTLGWPINGTRTALSVKDLLSSSFHDASWKIYKISLNIAYKNSASWDETESAMLVSFPAGSWSGSELVAGIRFAAKPSFYPSNEACLAYDLKFPLNFNWVLGGKLPGLWIGDYGATGGNYDVAGASCRLMWRADGGGEAYVYVPQQTDAFYHLPGYVNNNDKGQSIWRASPFQFKIGAYNHVKIYIKMNTFSGSSANQDGYLHISINDGYRSFEKMVWGATSPLNVSGLLFQSFFGGSDTTWATPTDQGLWIKNVITGNSLTACN